jgi:hypothetical protein
MALGLIMKYNDRTVIRMRAANGGIFERQSSLPHPSTTPDLHLAEMRLATTVYFAPFMPIALFIYGWTARATIHWIVPCLSFVPFGFGLLGIFVPCQTYMVDAFLETAASAVAAMVCLRCVFGALLPLVGPIAYQNLGLGWGNSLLGFLALAVTPVPFAFMRWGGWVRKRYPVEL